MPYIGKEPVIGNFVKLDAISVVNGQAAYTMNNGGSAFTAYDNVNQFLVSLNGVLQAPTDSFTVSGSTLTFASNLATGDVIDFVIVLGNTLDIGTPSDNTVSTAKIVDGAITSAKLGSGVGGKILQVVSTTKTDVFVTTSTSFTDVTGLSVSITPSSTSNKILVLSSIVWGHDATASGGHLQLNRGASALSTYNLNFSGSYTNNRSMASFNYLDSPSSTSAQTYKIQVKADSGNLGVNRSNTSTSDIGDSTITAIEVSA